MDGNKNGRHWIEQLQESDGPYKTIEELQAETQKRLAAGMLAKDIIPDMLKTQEAPSNEEGKA